MTAESTTNFYFEYFLCLMKTFPRIIYAAGKVIIKCTEIYQ